MPAPTSVPPAVTLTPRSGMGEGATAASADGPLSSGDLENAARRAALQFALLRLSYEPGLLPQLERALAALDHGGQLALAWQHKEGRLLRCLAERVLEMVGAEGKPGADTKVGAERLAPTPEPLARQTETSDIAPPAPLAAEVLHRELGNRETTERRGPTVLHFTRGELVRAERAFLFGAEHAGAGVEARRVDWAEPFSEASGRPLAEQIWARPVGAHIWGRGRLLLQPKRAVFVDEPRADTKHRGDCRPDGKRRRRNLEADLLSCAAVRAKCAASGLYAGLLCAALTDSTWRHESGSTFEISRRDAPRLVAQAVGAGDFTDWLWVGQAGVFDEEVLSDLGGLGWRRVGL